MLLITQGSLFFLKLCDKYLLGVLKPICFLVNGNAASFMSVKLVA